MQLLRRLGLVFALLSLMIVATPAMVDRFIVHTKQDRDALVQFAESRAKIQTVDFRSTYPPVNLCSPTEAWRGTVDHDWDWGTVCQWLEGKTAANYHALRVATANLLMLRASNRRTARPPANTS